MRKWIVRTFLVCAILFCGMFTMTRSAQAATNGWVVRNEKTYYYVNGVKKTGLITVDGKKYYMDPADNGAMRTRRTATIDGKKYYFCATGDMVIKRVITLSSKKYYFGSTGALVKDSHHVYYNSKYYYADSKGVLTEVNRVMYLAGKQLDAVGGGLKSAFRWSADLTPMGGISSTMSRYDLAKYGFEKGKGDCKVQAATFYYMAKARYFYEDKTITYMKAYVTNKKRTVYNVHAWVKIGSKVYDPNAVSYLRSQIPTLTKTQAVNYCYGFYYSNAGDGYHLYYCNSKKELLK